MQNFLNYTEKFEKITRFGQSYDVKKRALSICQKNASLYFCYCFANDILISEIISFYLALDNADFSNEEKFLEGFTVCPDAVFERDLNKAALEMLKGSSVLIVDGFDGAFVFDTKNIPSRSIGEPDSDRSLRGAHDGFVENIKENTAILRRRLLCTDLCLENFEIGSVSKSTIVLAYVDGVANENLVSAIKKKIKNIDTRDLALGSQSLAECLVKKNWWNPFPKFRFVERPDAVCAHVLEGSIALIVDTSPQVLLLPCSIFSFFQESDDFYFPALVGTYMRFLRGAIFLISMIITPLWLALLQNPNVLPDFLKFIALKSEPSLPIIVQLLLVEFLMDGLKLASMNTPNALNSSMSIVAGLIIGDFAVQVGWLVPEVILYMSFVATANYTQPSFELGYAIKFMRLISLICVFFFNFWGLLIGFVIAFAFVYFNKTPDGSYSYLYPLIPFDRRALVKMFIRFPKSNIDN